MSCQIDQVKTHQEWVLEMGFVLLYPFHQVNSSHHPWRSETATVFFLFLYAMVLATDAD